MNEPLRKEARNRDGIVSSWDLPDGTVAMRSTRGVLSDYEDLVVLLEPSYKRFAGMIELIAEDVLRRATKTNSDDGVSEALDAFAWAKGRPWRWER